MSYISNFLEQSAHYLTGRVLLMGAGLASFPILTRVFSVSDYGLLGLINTTLFFVIVLGKMGLPSAAVRFYEEYSASNRVTELYSTLFFACLFAVATIGLLITGFTYFLGNKVFSDETERIAYLVPLIAFVACASDVLMNFLRAEQRSRLFNVLAIVKRYGSLFLGISLIFFVIKGLYGFFVGHLLCGVMVFAFLLGKFWREGKISALSVKAGVLGPCLLYSLPVLLAEFGHNVLNYADRYLIDAILGRDALGLYTAGYNLTSYITEMIVYPLSFALTPVYMRILVKEGQEKTKEFFTKVLSYVVLIIVPLVFGFMTIGKELISVLASERYVEAHPIIPYVIIGQGVYALQIVLNSGLFIAKKTHIVTGVIFLGCIVNISLNLLLIPRYGIVGAAQATLAAYVVYVIIVTWFGFKEFSFRIEVWRITRTVCSGFAMFLLVSRIDLGGAFDTLMLRVVCGIVIYGGMILLVDVEVREMVVGLMGRVWMRGPKEKL